MKAGTRAVALALGLAMVPGARGSAQSMLERTPNLSGGWIGGHGTVHFNFLHRFTKSGPPDNQVSNNPTFLLGAGVLDGVFVGLHYATRSNLVARYPNEWEFFGRYAPITQSGGAPLDIALQGAYNLAAESVDGELSVARQFGRLRLLGSGRVLSNGFGQDTTRFALGGGAVLRVTRWIAIAGDAVALLDRREKEEVAWGAGVQLGIPLTPHTLSLQVTNTNAASVHGSSRGDDVLRYGFEFTVPITLSRYFGRRSAAVAANSPVASDSDADVKAAEARGQTIVRLRRIAFEPQRVQIAPGGSVVWRNEDQVVHTVKAADGSWESPEIQPGGTYVRGFAQAGSYEITCGPHPFMKMIVEVR